MAYRLLDVLSAAIFTALDVPALTALATGGISDDPAQATAFPYVVYELGKRNLGGLGTSELAEADLRVRAFTKGPGLKSVQAIDATVQELLTNQALTMTGYTQAGRVFYDDTILVPVSEINGEKVHEVISTFRIVAEAA